MDLTRCHVAMIETTVVIRLEPTFVLVIIAQEMLATVAMTKKE